MKNKVVIIVLIVLISFAVGISINYFKNQSELKKLESQYSYVSGTIIELKNNIATLDTKDEEIKNLYEKITFSIPENQKNNWVVGDIVKVNYLPGHISEDGIIEVISIESIGKERLFTPAHNIPVSNSDNTGRIVFKSFFAYNKNISLDLFKVKDDNIYYKKITTYKEYLNYKELIPELRSLTENDFIHYYLVIAMTTDINSIYMFEKINENSENSTAELEILKTKSLDSTAETPIYSGVSIVLPNVTDYEESSLEFKIK